MTISKLEIDSIEKIFEFLKKSYAEKDIQTKEIITDMDTYSVIELVIPAGPKAYSCTVGFRKKSHQSGQVMNIWTHTPMGTEKSEEVNVFDLKPFLVLQTFPEDQTEGFSQLKLEYKIGTVTTGSLRPVAKILGVIQSAIAFIMLEKSNQSH